MADQAVAGEFKEDEYEAFMRVAKRLGVSEGWCGRVSFDFTNGVPVNAETVSRRRIVRPRRD